MSSIVPRRRAGGNPWFVSSASTKDLRPGLAATVLGRLGGMRSRNDLGSRLAATRVGVWLISHVIAPLDRTLFRLSRGRWVSTGRPLAPMILLTSVGRRSGRERTTPVFALHDDDRVVICNVRPRGERPNPWPGNLDACVRALVDCGSGPSPYTARRATDDELRRYWPLLARMWPAYATHYAATGERSVFVLEPG